jgi:hypothetical protein
VNPVPIAEDIRLHFRVPAVSLVAEMRSSLEQLLHGDVGGRHNRSPSGYTSAGPRDEPVPKDQPSHRYDGPACGMGAHLKRGTGKIKAVRRLGPGGSTGVITACEKIIAQPD